MGQGGSASVTGIDGPTARTRNRNHNGFDDPRDGMAGSA